MGLEKYDELARLVAEARGFFEEFAAGKKVAATKARKSLQQIKRVAQDCRIDIQQVKQERAGGNAQPKCDTQTDAAAPS